MKFFTEPNGLFIIEIPINWQYVNVAAEIGEKSPYSFQHYENSNSSFQISCYPQPKDFPNKVASQSSNKDNLKFVRQRMDDKEFNIHLWFANVEDHYLMVKFIYDAGKEFTEEIQDELKKVEQALATLEFLTGEKRQLALQVDKYEKFMASLAASFDLRQKAMENVSLIEVVIITANQIDAYLRMAIVLAKQLKEKTSMIDIELLVQEKGDRPVMEKEIYQKAMTYGIIDEVLFDRLFELYGERNKVVHRFIISDFKTRDLMKITLEYDGICEDVRLKLREIEDTQFHQKIGMHGNRNPHESPSVTDVQLLFSQVNDKHLNREFFRKIDGSL